MNKKRLKIWSDDRLIYYQNLPDSKYWDEYWEPSIIKENYLKYGKGELDEYRSIFLKYLKRDQRILEAGCGNSKYVLSLIANGFDYVEGIDWAKQTIEKVKEIYPDLPIRVGDLTNIDVGDSNYDVYISLGVVEHRQEGPEPFLDEAYRVLKSGGTALFAVPFVNPVRRIKAKTGFYNQKPTNGYSFYQYAYVKESFIDYLNKSGFKVIETKELAGYYGLKEELPFIFTLISRMPFSSRIKRIIKRSWFLKYFSHICCFVCKK